MKRVIKRTGYTIGIEDDEAQITIIRPASGEYRDFKQYIVLYEDAHGALYVEAYTKEEISKKFNIDAELLKDIK